MGLDLHIDGERWRAHLRRVVEAYPRLVPVVKGGGYGLGLGRLARRCAWLGADTVAVGTYEEVPDVTTRFDGDVLVMAPWRPGVRSYYDRRVIHTVGRVADLETLATDAPGTRVVVEGLTSMFRHGMRRDELTAAASWCARLRLEGLALHLPMVGDRRAEAESWVAALQASRLDTATMWVSHLDDAELAALHERRAGVDVRPRIGTALWLGDRGALSVCSTVLDVHAVARGQRVGYRQRAMPRAGSLLVVAGGTAHGVALEAPTPASTVRQRAVAVATGGLEASGLALSPFTVAGRRRWFAEPPHMQVSMLALPASVPPPPIGSAVDAQVRFTTTHFDAVAID